MRAVAEAWCLASTLALVCITGVGATSGAAQDGVWPGSAADETTGAGTRTVLYGAVLGAALAATPVVLTSREPEEDVGIAILLGAASGGATGTMLALLPGARRNRWKGGLVGLGTGSVVGGLTLALAWTDPSIEFETPHKLAVGAVAGGALGLIVGGVLSDVAEGENDRRRQNGRERGTSRTPSSPAVRLVLSPSFSAPGRWTGSVAVPLR